MQLSESTHCKSSHYLQLTVKSIASSTTSKFKILVIEDDDISQRVVTMMLDQLGYEVVCVGTGKEALAIYPHFDLIVSDLGLPDIDGITICQTIRGQASTNHIPIIALTASANCKQDCLNAGFDGFMTKPVEYNVLQQLTQHFLTNTTFNERK